MTTRPPLFTFKMRFHYVKEKNRGTTNETDDISVFVAYNNKPNNKRENNNGVTSLNESKQNSNNYPFCADCASIIGVEVESITGKPREHNDKDDKHNSTRKNKESRERKDKEKKVYNNMKQGYTKNNNTNRPRIENISHDICQEWYLQEQQVVMNGFIPVWILPLFMQVCQSDNVDKSNPLSICMDLIEQLKNKLSLQLEGEIRPALTNALKWLQLTYRLLMNNHYVMQIESSVRLELLQEQIRRLEQTLSDPTLEKIIYYVKQLPELEKEVEEEPAKPNCGKEDFDPCGMVLRSLPNNQKKK